MRKVLMLCALVACTGCAPPDYQARRWVLDACADRQAVVTSVPPGCGNSGRYLCRKSDGSLWLYDSQRLIFGMGPTGVYSQVQLMDALEVSRGQ